MPAKSQAQFRAMEAAAHGHSTLGIPAKVGKEFVSGQSPKDLPKKAKSADHYDPKLLKKVASGLKKTFGKK